MDERLRRYLELGTSLAWREMVVRYKRSTLGVAWALIDPLLHVAVYAVVFGRFLRAGADVAHYPLYALLGVLPWLFLSMTIDQASSVLHEHAQLIRKIAFPHELLSFAVVLSRLSTLIIGLAVGLVVAAAMSGVWAPVAWGRMGYLVPGILLITLLGTGLGLLMSVMQVLFADANFIVRFMLRLGFYACPIVYPLSSVPLDVRVWYDLNPLVAILWLFQAASDEHLEPPSASSFVVAIVVSIASMVVGWWCSRRFRNTVAELL